MSQKKHCGCTTCPNLIDARESFCKQHRDMNRPSAHRRGYGKDWCRLSKAKLRIDPDCERCKSRPAQMVHHKIPILSGGERLDFDNLESLCDFCHARTHAEMNRKTKLTVM